MPRVSGPANRIDLLVTTPQGQATPHQLFYQLGDTVKGIGELRHAPLVIAEKLLAQGVVVGVIGRQAKGHPQHAACPRAGQRPVLRQRQRWQAAGRPHLVGRGTQVGGTVNQGAVQVEQHGVDGPKHQPATFCVANR
jgi:hypothetical protein